MRVCVGVVSALLVLGWVSSGLAGSVSYSYDEQGRLVGASYDNGTKVSYSYDATGNRVGKELQGGTSARVPEEGTKR